MEFIRYGATLAITGTIRETSKEKLYLDLALSLYNLGDPQHITFLQNNKN